LRIARPVSLAQKYRGAPEAEKVVQRTGNDAGNGDDFNNELKSGESWVHDAEARTGYS